MLTLAQDGPADWWEVEALYDLCFAPGREALSSYRLRDGVDPVAALSLVARADGVVAGAIRYWPVRVGATSALLLGPVAVHPTRQGEGLGALLVEESTRPLGSPAVRVARDPGPAVAPWGAGAERRYGGLGGPPILRGPE